ncbi:sugar ABC transporter permease [Streptomyces diacarni]|uniref:Sugar ABC transporter permease n=1 Tax=Streptomyces diacarni TaxID=2800381 RepID=A0A367EI43_9ACTN|nr:sugar ABC transporter permease [Streptomyces diacarni]RCG17758.1 sugar ABC transporter permease [Streptomyces diacarni]
MTTLPLRPRNRTTASTRSAGRSKRVNWAVVGLMAPWALGFTVFFAYPLLANVYLSLTRYDLISPATYIGLDNWAFLLHDEALLTGVRNSAWILLIGVPVKLVFAFFVALLISRARRGAGLLRTVFYLPHLMPLVAAALAFVVLLNPSSGPVNTLLSSVGIDGPLWFDDPRWAKPSLLMLDSWMVGNLMVIFLAAVLDVPQQLYEAADLDGAGKLRKLWHVTLPAVRPVLVFAAVTAAIDALQYFTQAYVVATSLSGGATTGAESLGYPNDSTLFFPVLLYKQGFRYFNMGYASVLALLLFAVSFCVAFVMLRRASRWASDM